MIFVLFCQVVMIPIEVSFYNVIMRSNYTQSPLWTQMRIIYDLICLADVVASFFTGYCDTRKNIVILNPKRIAM